VGNRVGKIGYVKSVGSDQTAQLPEGGSGLFRAHALCALPSSYGAPLTRKQFKPTESVAPHYDCHPANGQQAQPMSLSPAQMALVQTYVAT
jgi:hypothetical protein